MLCDIILLNFLKGAEHYKARKFEEVSRGLGPPWGWGQSGVTSGWGLDQAALEDVWGWPGGTCRQCP